MNASSGYTNLEFFFRIEHWNYSNIHENDKNYWLFSWNIFPWPSVLPLVITICEI